MSKHAAENKVSVSDLFGRVKDDDSGGFDESESADLGLHVRQCARRYRALDRKLDIVIRLILVLLCLYVLNVPGGLKLLLALVGG